MLESNRRGFMLNFFNWAASPSASDALKTSKLNSNSITILDKTHIFHNFSLELLQPCVGLPSTGMPLQLGGGSRSLLHSSSYPFQFDFPTLIVSKKLICHPTLVFFEKCHFERSSSGIRPIDKSEGQSISRKLTFKIFAQVTTYFFGLLDKINLHK